jgi:GTP cyclohydrolase II
MPQRVSAQLPTAFGEFTLISFPNGDDFHPHVVLLNNKWKTTPTIRIHSECLTGDALGSLRCDCGHQLHHAQQYIQEHGGAILYLRQEGRGIGLNEKIKAYALQDQGHDTVSANIALGHAADARDYELVKEILIELQLTTFNIITNNPAKIEALKSMGFHIENVIASPNNRNPHNAHYLDVKRDQMGHQIG